MKIKIEDRNSNERVEIPVFTKNKLWEKTLIEEMEEIEDKPFILTKNKFIALLIMIIVIVMWITILNRPSWINKLAELIKDNRIEIRYTNSEITRLQNNLDKLEIKDKALVNEYNLKLNNFIWRK